MWALVLTATMTAASIPLSAWAAPVPDEVAASEAKRHYEEGTKAFNLGEFARAISEFKATYNAKPDPLLLYNIAQSYRLAGDTNQALFFYKSFLRNMPGAANRKEIEAQIRKLEKQVQADEQKREGAAAPLAITPPPVVPPPVPAPATPEPLKAAAPLPLAPPTAAPTAAGAAAAGSAPAPAALSAAPPSPVAVLAAPQPPAAPINLAAPVPAEPETERPFYKKWWFWAGTAGAVVIVGVIAAANAKKAPTTTLGTFAPTFR